MSEKERWVVTLDMKDKDRVELLAAKLHRAIAARAEVELDLQDDKTWPKTGRTLWKRIREVTPLLEVHGIRAYRKTDNRAGRPIVLDTDFTDGPNDQSGANYAKHADDNHAADDNFDTSSADMPHSYAKSDDNGSNGRCFGGTLASNTSDRKERGEEGESNPDLSSAASDVSEEQLQRIHKLVYEGMAEKLTREEVLGKGWVES
jgi:hypothetical protein